MSNEIKETRKLETNNGGREGLEDDEGSKSERVLEGLGYGVGGGIWRGR